MSKPILAKLLPLAMASDCGCLAEPTETFEIA